MVGRISRYLGPLGLWGVGTAALGGSAGIALGILPYTGYTVSQSLARALLWLAITAGVFGVALIVIALVKHSQKEAEEKPQIEQLNLPDTLTAMHRRLTELQKEKASRTDISYAAWKKAMPTLADRMGIVRLRDWRRFEREVGSRLRRALPRKRFERILDRGKHFVARAKWKDEAHLTALAVASELKDELVRSADWTFDDAIKASNWLDGYDWGVKKLRDDDPQWQGLSQSTSSYLENDVLCNTIQRHRDFSLMCNNIRLLTHYSSQYKDDVFSIMLYEALVGSPISPDDVEMALSGILSDMEETVTRGSRRPGIVIGGLVGKATNVKISRCSSEVRIKIESDSGGIRAGGLVGEGETTEIVDSWAAVDIEHEQD